MRRRSYPEGYGCYCADQHANALSGGATRQKASPYMGEARKDDGDAGSERARQSPSNLLRLGRRRQPASPNCKSERSLRVKRLDP